MKIAILGAGGHGRVVLDILLQAGCAPETRSAHHAASAQHPAAADIVGFLDSNPEIHGRRVDGLPVLGGIDDLPRLRAENALDALIIAIGDNGIRRGYARQVARMGIGQTSGGSESAIIARPPNESAIIARPPNESAIVARPGIELVSAIHPSASIAQNAHVGRNTVVTAGVVICAHCQIGDSVILNTGCIIDHQSMIGEGVHICPGVRIAGRVKIEPGAFVGIGATILPKVTIGYESIVGAGAVVTEDVPDMATVVGVPAKQIKRSAADEETAAMLLPARL